MENAPETEEEVAAWDCVTRCVGQMRVGAAGSATGVDMGAAVRLLEVWGKDSAETVDLVCAAEQGIVGAVNGGEEQ